MSLELTLAVSLLVLGVLFHKLQGVTFLDYRGRQKEKSFNCASTQKLKRKDFRVAKASNVYIKKAFFFSVTIIEALKKYN